MYRRQGRVNSENGSGKKGTGQNQSWRNNSTGNAPNPQRQAQSTTLAGSLMRKAMSGPISSNTKTKLKAFEFKKQKSAPNSPPPRDIRPQPPVPAPLPAPSKQTKANDETLKPQRTSSDKKAPNSTKVEARPAARRTVSYNDAASRDDFADFPATPAPRIPLADLIPTSDKNVLVKDLFCDDNNTSPDERVMWQISPARSPCKRKQGEGREGKAKGGKRKRAASSSPICTPKKQDKGLEQTVFDLTTQSSMRTPMADPAMDLWNRYSTSTGTRPPFMAPLAPLSNILNSISPRPPNESPLALRRSYSCGVEWPNKKRKVTMNSTGAGKPPATTGQLNLKSGPKSPRTSRLSVLVEQIQKGITRPNATPSDPSDPSDASDEPSAHRIDADDAMDVKIASSPPHQPEVPVEVPAVVQENDAESSDSDEFGDFDYDMEEVEIAMTAVDNFTRTQHSVCEAEDAVEGAPADDQGDSANTVPKESQGSNEYDDGDDSIYSADIDLAISNYISTQQQQQQPQPAPLQYSVQPHAAAGNAQYHHPITNDHQDPLSDDYGDIDVDEWDVAEQELSKRGLVGEAKVKGSFPSARADGGKSDMSGDRIQRLTVVSVTDAEYEAKAGRYDPQKVLIVKYDKTGSEYTVFLRQRWTNTTVAAGDIVNIIGNFGSKRSCVINNTENFLILHPDMLISSTSVADSFDCLRKAALQERVKSANDITEASLYGNILHELLQCSLIANDFSVSAMNTEIQRIVLEHVQDFFALRVPIETGISHVKTKIPMLTEWANTFVSARPQPDAVATGHRSDNANMCIKKVLDVEEHIWSPKYGLKGNIDVTVEVQVEDRNGKNTWTAPLELKTGRNTKMTSHRAQTMMYTLLLSDRYDIKTFCSILYYLETSEVIKIPALRDELRDMIIGRNALACYVNDKDSLPPMQQDKHKCKRCYAKDSCFIYHKAFEDGTTETSGVGDIFDKKTAHLSANHAAFFSKWDRLLTKEEKDSDTFRKELWIMQGPEREGVGRCFSNLVILPDSNSVGALSASKINRYAYQFVKQEASPSFSFLESQIHVGEPIVVSDETGHFALSKGYVTAITKRIIAVAVDRRLHNIRSKKEGFNPENNQVFTGIMEVLEQGEQSTPIQPNQAPVYYRIDKDEFSAGLALVRNNLVELMKDGTGEKLRRLIIDLEAPSFKYEPTAFSMPSESQGAINLDQKRAIEKVMSANDYALVLGMPGTGKTTTIAHIIRSLVKQGKSVLLTSYTHTAVDNILLKIKDDKIPTLRLGVASKIHPDVKSFAALSDVHMDTFEEIRESLFQPRVVATTCLSIKHQIFSERIFDYCIVDEASQITLPVCLGPLRMAKSFVLVGDHYQLPPLVRNPEAKAGGLDVSLFKLLSDAHLDAVVSLEHQYRMCEDIMTLSNTLIYDGRLRCGTKAVAKASLKVPNVDALERFHAPPSTQDPMSICGITVKCWMKDLMQKNVKATFVNTDALPALEERKGDRTYNPVEANLTFQLVEGFLHCGVPASEIGVISIYRSQLAAIQNLFHGRPPVEMHTADKFQGRDKECIIISLVRSNDQGKVGDLLTDWRRINVAFTRARTKLIILGSKSTLKTNPLLGRFVDLMEERNWVYELKKGANLLHNVPVSPTGRTDSSSMGSPKKEPVKPLKKMVQTRVLKENQGTRNKVTKVPSKTGTVSKQAILASRPILRNIVNECS